MRVPLSLLKKYIEISESDEALSARLTQLGIEVEKIIPYTPAFSGVFVAQVVAVSPHPNAEKLRLVTLHDGREEHTIVCGASNCVVGKKVPFAKVGAKLGKKADGSYELEIKKAIIRGVESCGMICSEEELSLAETSEGILHLPDSFQVGEDLSCLLSDTIFEVALTPNLGHCLSIEGIARELSASFGIAMMTPYDFTGKEPSSGGFEVKLDAGGVCSSYGALYITGVEAKKSPLHLSLALEKLGIRQQNLLVDCANYVMMCTGQPMHVFDAQAFLEKKISLKEASGEEKLQLIDKNVYQIPAHALLVMSQNTPVAVAGVMGGAESAVSASTTAIVVESAVFDARSIRKTAKALGIPSEAAKRFERGIDPNGWKKALFLYWNLLAQMAPQAKLESYISAGQESVPSKSISVRLSKIHSILGHEVSRQVVEDIFSRLQYPYQWDTAETISVMVPAYRHDVTEEIDLIEDIFKLSSYEKACLEGGPRVHIPTMRDHPLYTLETEIRKFFVAIGLQEFVTCDLISPKMADLIAGHPVPRHAMISVLNPVSVEQSILRPSFLPSLIDCVKRNIDHGNRQVAAFEVGYVHLRNEAKIHERLVAGVVLCGPRIRSQWLEEEKFFDFFDIKAILESLVRYFSVEGVLIRKSDISLFHTGRQAQVFCGTQQVGTFGEIHPSVLRKLDIKERVYFMEIDVQDLMQHSIQQKKMTPLPLYPSIIRDWTITVPESLSYEELHDIVARYAKEDVESIFLQSIFRDEKLGKEKKNVTLRIVFRSPEKTLTSEQVDLLYAKLNESVSLALGL